MTLSRRRRVVLAAVNLALVALLGTSLLRAGRAAAALPRDRDAAEATTPRARNRALDDIRARTLSGEEKPLAEARGPALVLVFDPTCRPGAANMWNWTELARDLPADARLVALTLEGTAGAAEYWGALGRRVEVLTVDTATMRDKLRVGSTPSTLVVRDGRLLREYVGPLTRAARDEVTAELTGARRVVTR